MFQLFSIYMGLWWSSELNILSKYSGLTWFLTYTNEVAQSDQIELSSPITPRNMHQKARSPASEIIISTCLKNRFWNGN